MSHRSDVSAIRITAARGTIAWSRRHMSWDRSDLLTGEEMAALELKGFPEGVIV